MCRRVFFIFCIRNFVFRYRPEIALGAYWQGLYEYWSMIEKNKKKH